MTSEHRWSTSLCSLSSCSWIADKVLPPLTTTLRSRSANSSTHITWLIITTTRCMWCSQFMHRHYQPIVTDALLQQLSPTLKLIPVLQTVTGSGMDNTHPFLQRQMRNRVRIETTGNLSCSWNCWLNNKVGNPDHENLLELVTKFLFWEMAPL